MTIPFGLRRSRSPAGQEARPSTGSGRTGVRGSRYAALSALAPDVHRDSCVHESARQRGPSLMVKRPTSCFIALAVMGSLFASCRPPAETESKLVPAAQANALDGLPPAEQRRFQNGQTDFLEQE